MNNNSYAKKKLFPVKIEIAGNVTVNHATIIETEVFVYNLGTMFYIDQILYSDILIDSIKPEISTEKYDSKRNKHSSSVRPDVESIPSDVVTESNGSGGMKHIDDDDDFLLQDDEIVTPRALPVKYAMSKK